MIVSNLDENTYEILKARYQDSIKDGALKDEFKEHYEMDLSFNENRFEINYDYMQDLFEKFRRDKTAENKEKLIKSLAILSEADQEIALDIINFNDISGFVDLIGEINKIKASRLDEKIKDFTEIFGLDFAKLKEIYVDTKTKDDLNKANRLVDLINLADKTKVQDYYKAAFWQAKTRLYDDITIFVLDKNKI